MALIVCNACGKKVSDTVETCIHCGASLKEEPCAKEAKEENEEVLKSYDAYSEDDKLQMEKAFLAEDKWAKKIKRKEVILKKLYGWFSSILLLLVVFGSFCRYFGKDALEEKLYSLGLFELFAVVYTVLFVGFLLGIIIVLGIGAAEKRSIRKYIYMKKYQRWLKEAHDISYEPQFFEKKKKDIFDAIDLDKMNF